MKKFISGLIIGIMISTSITVFANDEIMGRFANLNFLVNGQDVELETRTLNVDGTSYLPLRELANVLGYDVDFDGATQTVILNDGISSNSLVNDSNQDKNNSKKIEIIDDPFENSTVHEGSIGEEIELFKSKIILKSFKYLGEYERNADYNVVEIDFDLFLPGEPSYNGRSLSKNRILSIGLGSQFTQRELQRTRGVSYIPITDFMSIEYEYGNWTNINLKLAVEKDRVDSINSFRFTDVFNRKHSVEISIN